MLLAAVGPASAHGWQTTVEQGPMELGVSSSPATPVGGLQTEFSARIADNDAAGDEDRLDWGGVTNQTVEVHIRGPNDFHDHVKTQIPEDDAHFEWTYMFPDEGTYTMAVVTELEGEEYAFEFQRNVSLIPTEAKGERVEHLSEEVHGVNENVDSVGEDVSSVQTQVDDLQTQVDELQTELEDTREAEASNSGFPGTGISAAVVAVTGGLAFVAGRRS
ncbi:hypothetical protein [Halobacterium rubrum]|uniref:hypothetical protein n=1 Tax=Halobacterium TaxID=2239 RepID=UPI001F3B6A84|nr:MULTISPECIES: hypothetical protein [Halobacterium]MDH5020906.1 hypothetical protein [Halobacterium rubrum]